MESLVLDFNGKSTREVKAQVEKLINKARISSKSLNCKFITDYGDIFLELQDLFKEYDLEPKNNSGTIEVIIE